MFLFTARLTCVAFRAIISDAEAVAGRAANAATTRLREIRKRKVNLLDRKLDWAVRFLHRPKVAELKLDCVIFCSVETRAQAARARLFLYELLA